MTPNADPSDPVYGSDRRDLAGDDPPPGGLPDFLTVEEAARLLRIGRTSAYQLAQQWCHTDGREGLPVVRLGRLLRVPRHELERLAGGELSTAPPAPPRPSAPQSPASPSRDEPPARATPQPHPRETAPTTSVRRARRDDRGTQTPLFPPDPMTTAHALPLRSRDQGDALAPSVPVPPAPGPSAGAAGPC